MSSSNVTLTQIPAGIRKPGQYLEYNTRLAVRALPSNVQSMLIIGQHVLTPSDYTVPALKPVQVFSEADASSFFGAGSLLHLMCKKALAENPYLNLTAISMDDAAVGGSYATWTVTDWTGPALAPGLIRLKIGTTTIEVAIATGQSAVAISANLVAAIRAVVSSLPVYPVGGVAPVFTLSARHKGTVANQIDISLEIVDAYGVTADVSQTVQGAVDPDITTALAKVFAGSYDKIVSPYSDETSIAALRDHLANVSGPVEERPGCGVVAVDSSIAAATTLAAAINDGRIVLALLRKTSSPAYEVAAALGAVWCREPDPARPLNGLPLVTVSAPLIGDRLSRTEQESCLANGITPLEVGPGERVQIVRLITTYTLNALGILDPALLDATTITSLDYGRKAIRQRIALRFPREKISTKGKTAEKVRTQILDVCYQLEALEIWDNVDLYKDQLIVEKDEQNIGQLNARIPANVVPGLHVFAGVLDLIL